MRERDRSFVERSRPVLAAAEASRSPHGSSSLEPSDDSSVLERQKSPTKVSFVRPGGSIAVFLLTNQPFPLVELKLHSCGGSAGTGRRFAA